MKITIEFERDFKSEDGIVAFTSALMGVRGANQNLKVEETVETEAKEEPVVVKEEPVEEEPKKRTKAETQALFKDKIAQPNGRQAVKELLAKYNATKFTQLTDDQYDAFYAELNEVE